MKQDKGNPELWRGHVPLASGNELQFFVNTETNLLVVDLVHHSGAGGNEIVRRTLDEPALLPHVRKDRNGRWFVFRG